MHSKKYVQLDANGLCFHEIEYAGAQAPVVGADLMDVTDRTDGPWLGKVYDVATDTFAWPEPTASLAVSASSIERGGTVTLRWETSHAVSAEIDQGVGVLTPVAGGEIEVLSMSNENCALLTNENCTHLRGEPPRVWRTFPLRCDGG